MEKIITVMLLLVSLNCFAGDTIVFKNADGTYGYDLRTAGIAIFQPFKPSLQGRQGFDTYDEALKCAYLIIEKRNKDLPATIKQEQVNVMKTLVIDTEIKKEIDEDIARLEAVETKTLYVEARLAKRKAQKEDMEKEIMR